MDYVPSSQVTGLALSSAATAGLPNALTSAVAIGGVCVFYAGFSLGLGPVPWVLAAEIFEHRLRARALAVLSATDLAIHTLGAFDSYSKL